MTVLTNNGNATYDEAIRASVAQLQADLRAAALEFGNRAGDELYPIYVAKVRLPPRPRCCPRRHYDGDQMDRCAHCARRDAGYGVARDVDTVQKW
jgi:hypothetical protein